MTPAPMPPGYNLVEPSSNAPMPIELAHPDISVINAQPHKIEPVYHVGYPAGGSVYLVNTGGYPPHTDVPVLGAGPPPRKGIYIPRRWFIFLIVSLMVAVIVAIVAPVLLTLKHRNAEPSQNSPYWAKVPYANTIYPSTARDRSTYRAYWTVSGYSPYLYGTASDYTAYPITTSGITKWRWTEYLSFVYGSCDISGTEYLDIVENGSATYYHCTISSTRLYSNDSCYVIFKGYWA
ncbi:hypothetical protein TWF694_005337 [Orbilia ellipsospora]|uniref:Uncharacterized protein n=1 Tax=Orbilia ellipsospora TaxID=2528407 RepID=A0AAV9WTW1_9PEZI